MRKDGQILNKNINEFKKYYRVGLCKVGYHKHFSLKRIIYEIFYDTKLNKNFHYTNLKKNIIKLDKNKECKVIKDFPDYKINKEGVILNRNNLKMRYNI